MKKTIKSIFIAAALMLAWLAPEAQATHFHTSSCISNNWMKSWTRHYLLLIAGTQSGVGNDYYWTQAGAGSNPVKTKWDRTYTDGVLTSEMIDLEGFPDGDVHWEYTICGMETEFYDVTDNRTCEPKIMKSDVTSCTNLQVYVSGIFSRRTYEDTEQYETNVTTVAHGLGSGGLIWNVSTQLRSKAGVGWCYTWQ